jgi:hypothetical protein
MVEKIVLYTGFNYLFNTLKKGVRKFSPQLSTACSQKNFQLMTKIILEHIYLNFWEESN